MSPAAATFITGFSLTLCAGAAFATSSQVTGVVTIGTTAHMEGQVLSQIVITMRTGSSANGRLLAQTAVTLASSTVVLR